MSTPRTDLPVTRAMRLAGDALTLALIGAVGVWFTAVHGQWIAAGAIAAVTVVAWFVLRTCARKVSGWHAKPDAGEVASDDSEDN